MIRDHCELFMGFSGCDGNNWLCVLVPGSNENKFADEW